MIDSQVIAFMFVAAMLTLTPGADTMLVVRNVLRGDRHDGIVTTCGICAGLFVHAPLSALGVSVILMHSATAFHLVKYAGACYLVWLGIQSLRRTVRGVDPPPGTAPRVTPDAIARQHCFLEGLLSNVLNPKVAVSMVVDQTRRFFLKSTARRWLDGVCGALLVGFGVRLALARQ